MCSSGGSGGDGPTLAPGVKSRGGLISRQAAEESQRLMQAPFMPGIEQMNDGLRRRAVELGYEVADSTTPGADPQAFTATKKGAGPFGVSNLFSVDGNNRTFQVQDGRRLPYYRTID